MGCFTLNILIMMEWSFAISGVARYFIRKGVYQKLIKFLGFSFHVSNHFLMRNSVVYQPAPDGYATVCNH